MVAAEGWAVAVVVAGLAAAVAAAAEPADTNRGALCALDTGGTPGSLCDGTAVVSDT